MKSLITLVLTMLISTLSIAQNGINYKAIIKDANGNIVASQPIAVQFAILQGVAQTNVYQEIHYPTTDANGQVIINIGEGTPIYGTYNTIDWASDTHFLNTQISTGGPLVNMGTTEFKTVPYAINAKTAANVSGLEKITEGSNTGWRLKGQDPNNYGNIGFNAVDLSQYNNPNSFIGATGLNSTAMGYGTIASGVGSSAMGYVTNASGNYATALGFFSTASGENSMAAGKFATASSLSSFSIGSYNLGGGNATTWVATDPLFEIGNGTGSSAKSNALTVLKNGTILAPSLDLAEITNPKSLITKEYADTNLASQEFISENGVTHTTHVSDNFVVGSDRLDFNNLTSPDNTKRMFFNKTKGAFRAGGAGVIYEGSLFNRYYSWNDAYVGDYSFASGFDNIASGFSSTATGSDNTASGASSTAMGNSSEASGISSISIGTNIENTYTTASGESSIAIGKDVTASGVNSIAIGSNSEASDYDSIAIGKDNVVNGYVSTALGNSNTASGAYAIALGTGNTVSGDYSTALGGGNSASAGYATAIGFQAEASGLYATAIGYATVASGGASTTMGLGTAASYDYATAMGSYTIASGSSSTAMGNYTQASGENSTAIGQNTIASSLNSLAIGQYNVGGGSANSWIATDPLFEVGFGTSSSNKLNALTVTKGGKVGIGTNTPTTFLQLTNGYEATLSNNSGYFMIGRDNAVNMLFDNNEIMVRNNGAIGNLYLQQNGGDVYVGAALVHSSDRRFKKDITPLHYGLETVLKLNPVAYNWIDRKQDYKSLGLIAQEVQPVISEIVHTTDDEAKTLSVSYTELIPVLIKAIKEQQDIINNQNSKIESLTAESNQKGETLKVFDARLKQIESLLKQTNQ